MKTKTKKITQYSMLALAASAVVPMSCGTKEAADDPNITFRTLSKTVTAAIPNSNVDVPIDINGDAVDDFNITSFYTNYAPERLGVFLENLVVGNEVATNTVSTIKMITPITSNTEINAATTTWESFGYGGFANNTPLTIGVNDAGDKYAAVRFKIGAGLHYGWLKFNVTNGSKTITIKEAAFDIRPDTAIKVGAK